jgi:protein-disulfide isomerase
MTDRRLPSRRLFLGTAATVALAGCTSSGSESDPADSENSDDTEENSKIEKLDEQPEGPPVLGDPDAEITLEVFEDYNCPHCQDYTTEQFPDVRADYLEPGTVRYIPRNLPFIHETSWQAASAVWEVYELYGTDQFVSYKSALMAEGGRIREDAPGIFGTIADEENLDADAIQQAGANRKHDETIRADRTRASELGVKSTPGFVVDSEVVESLAGARERIDSKRSE